MEPDTFSSKLHRFSLALGFVFGLAFAGFGFLVWRMVAPEPTRVLSGDLSISYAYESQPTTTATVADGKANSIAFHDGYIVVTEQHEDATQTFRVLAANRLFGFSAHKR